VRAVSIRDAKRSAGDGAGGTARRPSTGGPPWSKTRTLLVAVVIPLLPSGHPGESRLAPARSVDAREKAKSINKDNTLTGLAGA
jgi:hypothetical protein